MSPDTDPPPADAPEAVPPDALGMQMAVVQELRDAETLERVPPALRKTLALEMAAGGMSHAEIVEALGINRSTFFRWRKDDAQFAEDLVAAYKTPLPKLIAEAERRALRGSDKLMMFLLQTYDREKFAPLQKVEHSGSLNLGAALIDARNRARKAPPLDLC